MRKQGAWALAIQKKRWPLMILALFSLSTVMVFFMRTSFDSCITSTTSIRSCINSITDDFGEEKDTSTQIFSIARVGSATPNPLDFMNSKLVLLVSHELSLSGGPLLLMELAFLLSGVGSEVVWITNQKPAESEDVVYSFRGTYKNVFFYCAAPIRADCPDMKSVGEQWWAIRANYLKSARRLH